MKLARGLDSAAAARHVSQDRRGYPLGDRDAGDFTRHADRILQAGVEGPRVSPIVRLPTLYHLLGFLESRPSSCDAAVGDATPRRVRS